MAKNDLLPGRAGPTLLDESFDSNLATPGGIAPPGLVSDEGTTHVLDGEIPCVEVDAETATFLEAIPDGYALLEVRRDETGATADCLIVDVNGAFEGMCGLSSSQLMGRSLVDVLPDTEAAWLEACGQVEATGHPVRIESFSESLRMNLEVLAFRIAPRRVACLFQDVTERSQSLPPPDGGQAELRAVVARLTHATESERASVATALERTVDARLPHLGALLGTVQGMIDAGDHEKAARALDEALSKIGEMGRAVRAILGRLRPAQLETHGLYATLGWYAERYSMSTDLLVLLEGAPPTRRLPTVAEMALFRVVEETLDNVAQHSGATRATIDVEETPAALVVSIRDEGSGFDVHALRAAGNGVGLLAMKERVASVGGTLRIDAAAGQGTTLVAAVPWTR